MRQIRSGAEQAGAQSSSAGLNPETLQSYIFTIQTCGVCIVECDTISELMNEFDLFLKEVAQKPERYACTISGCDCVLTCACRLPRKVQLSYNFDLESYEKGAATLREGWKNMLCVRA